MSKKESKKGTLAICLVPPLTVIKRARDTAFTHLIADVAAHLEQGISALMLVSL